VAIHAHDENIVRRSGFTRRVYSRQPSAALACALDGVEQPIRCAHIRGMLRLVARQTRPSSLHAALPRIVWTAGSMASRRLKREVSLEKLRGGHADGPAAGLARHQRCVHGSGRANLRQLMLLRTRVETVGAAASRLRLIAMAPRGHSACARPAAERFGEKQNWPAVRTRVICVHCRRAQPSVRHTYLLDLRTRADHARVPCGSLATLIPLNDRHGQRVTDLASARASTCRSGTHCSS
jgi:hypothetical protein